MNLPAFSTEGVHIFPVRADKTPALHESWERISSNDPDAIRSMWFRAGGEVYVAIDLSKSGLTVVDVDYPEKVPTEFQRILDDNPTYTAQSLYRGTPHHYFAGTIPGFNFPGGECKGRGGYIVVSNEPPIRDGIVAAVPPALMEWAPTKRVNGSGRVHVDMEAWLAEHDKRLWDG